MPSPPTVRRRPGSFATAFTAYLQGQGQRSADQAGGAAPPGRGDATQHSFGHEVAPLRPTPAAMAPSPHRLVAQVVSLTETEGVIMLSWCFDWDAVPESVADLGDAIRSFEVVQQLRQYAIEDGGGGRQPVSWPCSRPPFRLARPAGCCYSFVVRAVICTGADGPGAVRKWASPFSMEVSLDLHARPCASPVLPVAEAPPPCTRRPSSVARLIGDEEVAPPRTPPRKREEDEASLPDDTLERISQALRAFELTAGGRTAFGRSTVVGGVRDKGCAGSAPMVIRALPSPLGHMRKQMTPDKPLRQPLIHDEPSPSEASSGDSPGAAENGSVQLQRWVQSIHRRMRERQARVDEATAASLEVTAVCA
mmetsp:Transcript_77854/g.166950  ORF Transcript_77854/g.166950 Transcript_77854/m.166950 type:complete len:365 (+) Transcript_77854:185-1279(+)